MTSRIDDLTAARDTARRAADDAENALADVLVVLASHGVDIDSAPPAVLVARAIGERP